VDRSWIEDYAAGGATLALAIKGLSQGELDAHPVPGTWSIRQIVIHMMDSDLIASDRMKRVAAMERPLLMGYDETAFSELPGSETLDVDIACEIFAKNRLLTAHVLRHLPDAAFERYGIHSENGKVTLAYFVRAYIDHLEHHMKFVRDKRQQLGKPMA
jgi:hypothetical protein